jgi:glycine cleavage system regulatory protein
MLATLVMTVIGGDRPGLVEIVAAKVADHGGNWLESRMCRLGGQFAGILRVEFEETRRDELIDALHTLAADGLQLVIHPEDESDASGQSRASGDGARPGSLAIVELVGTDRPGILRRVSGVFAALRINVEEITSERANSPMNGGVLFKARATVLVPHDVKLSAVRFDLEQIAADLMVDLTILPA